jgi:hypothetical protein
MAERPIRSAFGTGNDETWQPASHIIRLHHIRRDDGFS